MKLPGMAVFALSLALAFHVLGDDAPTGPKDLGTVTIGDKTYTNLHVTSVTDLGIKATWDGGLGTILFSDMPPDLQKKFGYDPNKFKAAENAQAEHDAQSDAEAAAQAKVDQANLKQSDADAAKQRAAVMAPKKDAVKGTKYLVGNVLSSVPGGYSIRLAPVPTAVGDNGFGGGYGVGPRDPWPRVGYDITVVLKSNKVHTVGEDLAIPVVEDGTYRTEGGDYYKAYSEPDSNPK
jgi:hypothetical protein